MLQKIASSQDPDEIEALLNQILYRIHAEGPIYAEDFESLALIRLFHPKVFSKKETEILYLTGLFYKVNPPSCFVEEVYSIFANAIADETGRRFTPVQADAYRRIHSKLFFSFSAPTSAGKSFLFRELITNADNDIVIVVPSRALIAEYLNVVRDMMCNDNSVLVLQFIDNVNIAKTRRRVFIITPERGNALFSYKAVFPIGLFLFDEAQLSEEEIRGLGFDAFVRRVCIEFPNASKVFAHPYVQNPEAQLNKHHFATELSASSNYKQNTVGKIFITIDSGQLFYFSPYENTSPTVIPVSQDIIGDILSRNGTILVYSSKSKLYSSDYIREFRKYLHFCPPLRDPDALKYIEELRDYIGADNTKGNKVSLIVQLMRRGIVIHHGSMPLKMRLIIEEFVRANHAKLCFATSTLNQGINMPFDAVFIDNYRKMDALTLKNLIGRSGRSTERIDTFDFGYTIVKKRNVASFRSRINEAYCLSDVSKLDIVEYEIDEDNRDIVEAIRNNEFDDEMRLTKSQIIRLKSADATESIINILETLLFDGHVLTGREYYETLGEEQRNIVKDAFKKIYIIHLRRDDLTPAEKRILSTSVPILLWHIQGKTFKEVLALRHAYLTQQSERLKIKARHKEGSIDAETADIEIANLTVRFSQAPYALPNRHAALRSAFGIDTPVLKLDYDTLVFDTYDYIDKVINLSLSDPLCAAFQLYFEKTGDLRAKDMCNLIRYGTTNPIEIWLLRYGFSFEDITWIKPYVESINEQQIIFSASVNACNAEQREAIKRYL